MLILIITLVLLFFIGFKPFLYVFLFFGHIMLSALYGIHNFDYGPNNRMLYIYSFVNLSALILGLVFFPLLIVYVLVLIAIGYYNRKHKKTYFRNYGDIIALRSIAGIDMMEKHQHLMSHATMSCLEFCEDHRGYDLPIFRRIEQDLKMKLIDLKCAEILWERYNSAADPTAFPEIDFNVIRSRPENKAAEADTTAPPETDFNATRSRLGDKSTQPESAGKPRAPSQDRYRCSSIVSTKSTRYGKCLVCKSENALSLCKIKNHIGTREIYICDACYRKFSDAAKN